MLDAGYNLLGETRQQDCTCLIRCRAAMLLHPNLAINLSAIWFNRHNLFALLGLCQCNYLLSGAIAPCQKHITPVLAVAAAIRTSCRVSLSILSQDTRVAKSGRIEVWVYRLSLFYLRLLCSSSLLLESLVDFLITGNGLALSWRDGG